MDHNFHRFLSNYRELENLFKPNYLKQDKKLFEMYHKGLIEEKFVVAQYYKMAIHLIEKYKINNRVREEAFGYMMIGLIKAIRTFKPEKGYAFATYGTRCMINEYFMFTRQDSKHLIPSIEEPLSTDMNGNSLFLKDILPTSENGYKKFEFNEDIKVIKKIIDGLNETEKKVIKMIFFHNKKQREVSEELNISQSYVSRLEKRALEKIKNMYERVIA